MDGEHLPYLGGRPPGLGGNPPHGEKSPAAPWTWDGARLAGTTRRPWGGGGHGSPAALRPRPAGQAGGAGAETPENPPKGGITDYVGMARRGEGAGSGGLRAGRGGRRTARRHALGRAWKRSCDGLPKNHVPPSLAMPDLEAEPVWGKHSPARDARQDAARCRHPQDAGGPVMEGGRRGADHRGTEAQSKGEWQQFLTAGRGWGANLEAAGGGARPTGWAASS